VPTPKVGNGKPKTKTTVIAKAWDDFDSTWRRGLEEWLLASAADERDDQPDQLHHQLIHGATRRPSPRRANQRYP
jgi:hypothetical protein